MPFLRKKFVLLYLLITILVVPLPTQAGFGDFFNDLGSFIASIINTLIQPASKTDNLVSHPEPVGEGSIQTQDSSATPQNDNEEEEIVEPETPEEPEATTTPETIIEPEPVIEQITTTSTTEEVVIE